MTPPSSEPAIDVLWQGTVRALVLSLATAGFATGVAALTWRDRGADLVTIVGGLGLVLQAGWASRRIALLCRPAWPWPAAAFVVACLAALPATTTVIWYLDRLHLGALRFGWSGILRGGVVLAALVAGPIAVLLTRSARARRTP